jgi:hypothetical protein
MTALVVGDQVRWKRGAVGLTGRVIDFIFVPNAPEQLRVILKMETPRGTYCEYPSNLELDNNAGEFSA